MTFRLFEDRIAVLADPEKDTTESGIVLLPDSNALEQMRYGTVAVVGAGHVSDYTGTRVIVDLEVGDRVFFNRHSGSPITIDDVEYLFLNAREIVGVLDAE